MDKEEFLAQLKKLIEERKEDYGNDALISSVIIKEKGEWKNYATKIIILHKEDNTKIRQNILYDDFALLEKRVPIHWVIGIFENENGFELEGFKIKFRKEFYVGHTRYEPSNNECSEYPGNLYYVGGDTIEHLREPTVKYNVPCYVDGVHAVKDWLSLSNFNTYSDGRFGKIVFFLPNFKARIIDLELKEDKLLVRIKGRKDILKSLQCQAVFTFAGNKTSINKNFEGKTKVEFNIKNKPEELFIQLVTPDNEKIDYYRETPYLYMGQKRLLKKEFDKEVIEVIRNGENEKTEFKPFIEKGNTKESEIIRTVIAFANTNGGLILFGIEDNCEVVGIKPNILKGEEVPTFLNNYKNHLRKTVSDKLNKEVELVFKEHTVSGKQVLEMSVIEGKDKAYCTVSGNHCYIRKGSTNRIPDPDTELIQLYNQKRDPSMMFIPGKYGGI